MCGRVISMAMSTKWVDDVLVHRECVPAMNTISDLPPLDVIVAAADASLHPWVHAHVAEPVRRASLGEELSFWLNTAAQDMGYATGFAEAAPQSGEPPEAYLDRWLPLPDGSHVLAGPRYLG